MNFYENNIKVLRDKHKIDIKKEVQGIGETNDGVAFIEKDKKIYFDYEDKRIDEYVKNIEEEKKVYILIGFGIGICAKKILNCIGNSKLIIFENNQDILNFALRREDVSYILKDERVTIEFCNNKNVDFVLENNVRSMFFSDKVNVVICPGYNEIDVDFVKTCVENIKKAFNNAVVNKNTLAIISENILECVFENMPYIIKSNSIRNLKNIFKDKPAVIVSSGPSLSKNIHYLKEYNDKVVIITGSRNLDYMASEGIIPHIVCTVDSLDIVYDFTKNSFDKELYFVSTEHANAKTVKKLEGRNIFATVLFNDFINKITKNKYDKFPGISSVAHLCSLIAVYSGCENIMFIGQDLAFTDNKLHDDFSGARYEHNKIDNRSDLFYVKGNYEEKVLTNMSFQNFKEWLEKYIAENKHINFVNCTEGGAEIKGTKVARFKEMLEKFCKDKIMAEIALKKAYNTTEKFDKYRIVHEIMKIEEEIMFIKAQYINGVELCKEIYAYNNGNIKIDIKKVVSEFSKIDEAAEGKIYINSLINILALVPLKKIINNKEFVESLNDTPKIKGIKYALRNKAVCELYIQCMDKILSLIKKCIEEVEEL
ncbi:motility associated factor glycosyltransferase family protein [Clostridium felsineum]|uniref:motility associated factor glycosyltransferase family protein n=1 Tax=Clostridium felsineum TaxID=36839 RepID=UPI00098C8502|nr:6-hydroxymethylpterin diphosphokinase MptE-like protein [Clostridium felsineum]URZ01546.1 hypothetical protein CLAUR_015410 [Clostridium felsineum]